MPNKNLRNKNKLEWETVVIDVARVARVTAGGKRLSFRATVAVGLPDNFQLGVATEKGKDVAQAIQKATKLAQKNIITVPVINNTIPHPVKAKHSAAEVLLKPAKEGKGVIAGGIVRALLKLAGIPNITAKILGRTNNSINNARAVLLALKQLKTPHSFKNNSKTNKTILEGEKDIKQN